MDNDFQSMLNELLVKGKEEPPRTELTVIEALLYPLLTEAIKQSRKKKFRIAEKQAMFIIGYLSSSLRLRPKKLDNLFTSMGKWETT